LRRTVDSPNADTPTPSTVSLQATVVGGAVSGNKELVVMADATKSYSHSRAFLSYIHTMGRKRNGK